MPTITCIGMFTQIERLQAPLVLPIVLLIFNSDHSDKTIMTEP